MVAEAHGRRELLTASLIVAAAAAIAYGTTITNYFVQDDFGVVALLSQKPALYFPRWFVSTWMDDIWGFIPDEIRPFPAVTYQLAALGGATSTWANHLMNIALHAANGVLVLTIARRAAALSVPGATLAALAFVLLPVQSESVAWITGRVDSMPAFFYLASFLAWIRWREGAGRSAYVWSLALFFVALFTKQNTITMVATLAAYDILLAPRTPSGTRVFSGGVLRATVVAYLPFVALTVAYLALRYILFGAIARENQLDARSADFVLLLLTRHLHRLVLGSLEVQFPLYVALLVLLTAIAIAAWTAAIDRQRVARVLLYFGVVWIAIGVAPIAVAGYDSPRHIYLAAVGWAVTSGTAFDVFWSARPVRLWRPAAAVAAVAVLASYAMQLSGEIRTWNTRAAVSQRAVADLQREALAAPDGALVIVGAPIQSWEWALPFAARPPFADRDLTARLLFVSPMRLYCCRDQWEADTRKALQAWQARSGDRAVVALHWDPQTGKMSRLTDRSSSDLRAVVSLLTNISERQALDETLLRLLDELVAGHES